MYSQPWGVLNMQHSKSNIKAFQCGWRRWLIQLAFIVVLTQAPRHTHMHPCKRLAPLLCAPCTDGPQCNVSDSCFSTTLFHNQKAFVANVLTCKLERIILLLKTLRKEHYKESLSPTLNISWILRTGFSKKWNETCKKRDSKYLTAQKIYHPFNCFQPFVPFDVGVSLTLDPVPELHIHCPCAPAHPPSWSERTEHSRQRQLPLRQELQQHPFLPCSTETQG